MQGIRGRTNSLGSSFRAFFNSEKLCDVTFIIQEQKYFAHKLVLAARSPYFNNLILVNCKHSNTLEIEIQDALPHIFLAVLEYMYTDTTLLKQENVWEIFQAAKFYQLSDLCTLCEEFAISTLSEKNVFDHWKRSQGLDAHQTMEHCAGFVKIKFAAELTKANIPLHTVSPVANVEAVMNAVKNLPTPQTQPQAPSKDVTEETSTQAELYTSLSNYSFPLKGAPPQHQQQQQQQQTNGTIPAAPVPASTTATQPLKEEDENTVTQTFEYWGSQMPPAAFPTPESMAAFPQFFRVDDKQAPVKQEQQSTSSTSTTTTTTAATNTMAAIAALTPLEKRKRSLLCRRLSVIPQADPSSVAAFFQHMISAVTRLLESERTTLFMYDKESDELCSQVAVGDVEIRIPSNKGIAGSVFKSGKPANISDAYSNDKFASDVDKNTGFTTRYVLCSPILGKNNQVVGVIEVLNKYSGPFNDEDETHLKTAALLLCKFLEDQLDDTNSIPKALASQVMLLNPSSYRRKTDDLFSFVFDNVDDISDLLTETGQDNTNLLHQPNNVRSQSPIYASYQNGPNVQAPPVPVNAQPLPSNVAAATTAVAAQQPMQPPMPVQQALPQPANTSTMAAAVQRMQPSPSIQPPPQQQQPMVALQPTSVPIAMSPELLQHQMMMQYLQQQQQQQMQQQQQKQMQQGIPLEIQQQMQQQQQQMQQQNAIAQQWNSVTAQQMQQFTQNLIAAQRPQQQFNFVPQPQGSRKRAHPEGEVEETETKKRRLNPAAPKQAGAQPQQNAAPTTQPQQQPQQGQGKRDAPFMHFRIPRYELQFIQYDGSGKKK